MLIAARNGFAVGRDMPLLRCKFNGAILSTSLSIASTDYIECVLMLDSNISARQIIFSTTTKVDGYVECAGLNIGTRNYRTIAIDSAPHTLKVGHSIGWWIDGVKESFPFNIDFASANAHGLSIGGDSTTPSLLYKGSIYSLKQCRSDGELVANLVAHIKNGVSGLLDTISNIFYGSANCEVIA